MKQRVVTGFLGAIVFLTAVIIGGTTFTLFIALVASVAMIELLKMRRIRPLSVKGLGSLALMWVLLVPPGWLDVAFLDHVSKTEIFIFMILLLLALTVVTKNSFTFDEVGFAILSSVYVGYGFHYLITSREIPEVGLQVVFLILFAIWSTDSGAYFVGRKWGRKKLSPHISPKKTVEGSVGGIVAAFVVGFIFHSFFPIFDSVLHLTGLLVVTSIFGQLGDLVESALKRHYAVKDSGNVLPGHGGILDRFDSLIFVMPILHLLQFLG
ncbi:phosphatidate cytidylyltransferase [Thalassorhabdus alkalitolerans]|uniref:Phosphatidate cytidylyltransferase n=1 Tax=Thalassorhabdus alkalitolerans TaxID=2282697 RepID=A0ABW0YN14_9BACI|nr:phosphatidate cytidylyltransferase [Thalassobacillus sp. C254]